MKSCWVGFVRWRRRIAATGSGRLCTWVSRGIMDSIFELAAEVFPDPVCVAQAAPRQRIFPAWIRLEGAGRPSRHGSAGQHDPRVADCVN